MTSRRVSASWVCSRSPCKAFRCSQSLAACASDISHFLTALWPCIWLVGMFGKNICRRCQVFSAELRVTYCNTTERLFRSRSAAMRGNALHCQCIRSEVACAFPVHSACSTGWLWQLYELLRQHGRKVQTQWARHGLAVAPPPH